MTTPNQPEKSEDQIIFEEVQKIYEYFSVPFKSDSEAISSFTTYDRKIKGVRDSRKFVIFLFIYLIFPIGSAIFWNIGLNIENFYFLVTSIVFIAISLSFISLERILTTFRLFYNFESRVFETIYKEGIEEIKFFETFKNYNPKSILIAASKFESYKKGFEGRFNFLLGPLKNTGFITILISIFSGFNGIGDTKIKFLTEISGSGIYIAYFIFFTSLAFITIFDKLEDIQTSLNRLLVLIKNDDK